MQGFDDIQGLGKDYDDLSSGQDTHHKNKLLTNRIDTKMRNNKIHQFLRQKKGIKNLVYQFLQPRGMFVVEKIIPFLPQNTDKRILDIGSGSCNVADILIKKRHNVTLLDIQNHSFVNSLSPTIYDGINIPFKNDQFDISLLLFVLHHTPRPESLLAEAKRVSKKIIVLEDIIKSKIHKHLTGALDAVMNLEFDKQPHSNKKNSEWLDIFSRYELNVLYSNFSNYGPTIRHAMYILEK